MQNFGQMMPRECERMFSVVPALSRDPYAAAVGVDKC